MSDPRFDPHGPEKLPDRQPMPQPADVTAQESLQKGASSRWLVPSAILAAIAVVLFAWAFTLQLLLPIIGIVYVVVIWVVMLLVSRAPGDVRTRNRRLAWFMGALAVGALVVFLGIYIVEVTREAQL